ncbi:hypothetical protein I4U23_000193 [Adineta vaga]|nr:hypothetical protein I4U23_000193 [Adineta vaga]
MIGDISEILLNKTQDEYICKMINANNSKLKEIVRPAVCPTAVWNPNTATIAESSNEYICSGLLQLSCLEILQW